MVRALRRLPAVLGAVLLFLALYAVQLEFRHLRLDAVGHALAAIPPRALGLAGLFTILSYAGLTIYDWLGTVYAGRAVGYGRIAFASFCAYALSHSLGFAAVSGAAVRYRLYAQWGLTPGQIARVVAFCSLTFGLGGMVLGGAILFVEPRAVPYFGEHLPDAAMYGFGLVLWGIVGGYVSLARWVGTIGIFGKTIALPGFRIALAQVALATADVALTATIFWVLVPHVPKLTWLIFLGIYVGAYTAGLAANVPGGLGVFDSAILFGLAPYVPAPRVVAAIVIFRLCYYVIPLLLAGVLFAANETLIRANAMLGGFAPFAWMRRLARAPEPDFALAAVTGAVALSGVLLLGLGVLVPGNPAASADILAQAGVLGTSLIGALLVVLGAALVQRVTLAWWLTLLALGIGAMFVSSQGGPRWIVAMLILSAVVLTPFRVRFYRPARLLRGKIEPSTAAALLALIMGILALVGFRRGVSGFSGSSWWEIILSPLAEPGLRLSVLLTVFPGLLALWYLLRPGRVRAGPWDSVARARLREFATIPPGGADGVMWGESARAGLPFRRMGRILLGLGDPVGPKADRISAIWRLRDLAAQEGRDPAILGAGPELLTVYGDLGLAALPLGPDGMPGEAGHSDRYLVCVAERDLALILPMLPDLARSVRPASSDRAALHEGRAKALGDDLGTLI
ncbi:MAG: lysylphosphatidylglycerol synthetase family protein [Rhodospirillales bacterium]|nr:lysylphosphatidylglycerol synthetase family protein [Rhodospirillales bacterium]